MLQPGLSPKELFVSFSMEVRTTTATAIVTCTGALLLGPEADSLRAAVYDLIYRHERVVLDLTGVTRVDCAGLGVIAHAAGMAARMNKSLAVCGASGAVDQVLTLTRLHGVLDTFDAREVAAA